MGRTNRRQILSMTAMAATVSAIGCNSSNVIDPITKSVDSAADGIQGAVESTSTSDLKRYKIALRGYQFVSMYIAGRVVFLPYPGMRILSVIIIASSVAAKLTVEYIDDELINAKLRSRSPPTSVLRLNQTDMSPLRPRVELTRKNTYRPPCTRTNSFR